MTEGDRLTRTASGGQIDQRARYGRRGGDRHRRRAHHGVVQFAHGERAHAQVDLAGLDRLAAGGDVIRRRGHEGDFGGVLAIGGLRRVGDQPILTAP